MTVSYGRLGAASGRSVRLDRDEALRYLGYSGQQVDDALLARFHALADACEQTIEPTYAWDIFDVDEDTSSDGACGADGVDDAATLPRVVLVSAPVVLSGKDISAHLKGARKVALMACTLGMASEREYRRQASLSAADAAMFGACCSALVEAAANAVEAMIVAEASQRGMKTNWRYSPGYGDLPLDVQPAFLRSLDATRKLGINVTSTNMLLPVKSVTAVVGLFDEGADEQAALAGAGPSDSTCAACPALQDCEFRRKGGTCHG